MDGVLKTDLFVKPTGAHLLLDKTSSHPYHCKTGILYSQSAWHNRICSDNEKFVKMANGKRL